MTQSKQATREVQAGLGLTIQTLAYALGQADLTLPDDPELGQVLRSWPLASAQEIARQWNDRVRADLAYTMTLSRAEEMSYRGGHAKAEMTAAWLELASWRYDMMNAVGDQQLAFSGIYHPFARLQQLIRVTTLDAETFADVFSSAASIAWIQTDTYSSAGQRDDGKRMAIHSLAYLESLVESGNLETLTHEFHPDPRHYPLIKARLLLLYSQCVSGDTVDQLNALTGNYSVEMFRLLRHSARDYSGENRLARHHTRQASHIFWRAAHRLPVDQASEIVKLTVECMASEIILAMRALDTKAFHKQLNSTVEALVALCDRFPHLESVIIDTAYPAIRHAFQFAATTRAGSTQSKVVQNQWHKLHQTFSQKYPQLSPLWQRLASIRFSFEPPVRDMYGLDSQLVVSPPPTASTGRKKDTPNPAPDLLKRIASRALPSEWAKAGEPAMKVINFYSSKSIHAR